MKKASRKVKSKTAPATRLQEEKPKPVEKEEPSPDDGRMDFGGLPDRDLKKNLGGCG